MTRWLIGLAFAVFLVALIGLVNVTFAAIDLPDASSVAQSWQATSYPSPTTQPAYPAQQTSPSPTVTLPNAVVVQTTPTVGTGGQATATPATATPQWTRTITPIPSLTPTPTRTVQVLPSFTPSVTPIRVIGLPVPGPGDNLPSTGGSMLSTLTLLLMSGGLGGVLFVVGRVLRRRQR